MRLRIFWNEGKGLGVQTCKTACPTPKVGWVVACLLGLFIVEITYQSSLLPRLQTTIREGKIAHSYN